MTDSIRDEQKAFFDQLDKATVTYVHDADDMEAEEVPCIIGLTTGWGKNMKMLVHPVGGYELKSKKEPSKTRNAGFLTVLVYVFASFMTPMAIFLSFQVSYAQNDRDAMRNYLCQRVGGQYVWVKGHNEVCAKIEALKP